MSEFVVTNPMYVVDEVALDKPKNYHIHRAALCCLAVALLWSTSLEISVKIIAFTLPAPLLSNVISECSYGKQIVDNLKENYRECVANQLNECHRQLERETSIERARNLRATVHNEAIYHQYSSLTSNCSFAYDNAKLATQIWLAEGIGSQLSYNHNCSAIEVSRVKSLLGDTSSSTAVASYASSLAYSDNSVSVVSQLAQYSVQLSQYNSKYLNNKTGWLGDMASSDISTAAVSALNSINTTLDALYLEIDQLVACIGLSNVSSVPCSNKASARPLYDNIQVTMNAELAAAQGAFNTLLLEVTQYEAQVNTAIAAANSFYQSVQGAQGLVSWIVKNLNVFNAASQLCGKSTPDWCSFSEASWYIAPPTFLKFPKLQLMPGATAIWNQVKSSVTSMKFTSQHHNSAVLSAVQRLATHINSSIQLTTENLFVDYSPPVYPSTQGNVSVEAAAYHIKAMAFQNTLTQLFSPNVSNAPISNSKSAPAIVQPPAATVNKLSSFQMSWAKFKPTGDLNVWLLPFLNLQSLMFLLDWAYRLLHTARLVQRYWSNSVVQFPALDKRVHPSDSPSPAVVYCGLFMRALPFVWLQLALLLAFLVMFVVSLTGLAVMEFKDYSTGCVLHTTNSTYISSNLYSVAFDYAASQGNSAVSSGIAKYNSLAASHCSTYQGPSAKSSAQLQSLWSATNQTLQNVLSNRRAVQACVAWSASDALVAAACCGQAGFPPNIGSCNTTKMQCPMSEGVPYQLPHQYLNQRVFDDVIAWQGTNATFQSSVFNCANLPQCKMTCLGPDPEIVATVSKSCACMAQWYANANLLQMFGAAVMFITLNISRCMVGKGLTHVLWRYLVPEPVFEYKVNCNEKGVIIRNKEDEESGNENIGGGNSVVREHQFRNFTRNYECAGYGYVLIGIAINIPWIIGIKYLNANATYIP